MKPGDKITADSGRTFVLGEKVTTWILGRDPKCKSAMCGGSHYHCVGCGAVTSMYGHQTDEDCERAIAAGRGDPDWIEVVDQSSERPTDTTARAAADAESHGKRKRP
jgi:hypothetical protein